MESIWTPFVYICIIKIVNVNVYILFGSSGCGKSTYKKYLISKGIKEIKSYTTRKKRTDEDNEYIFISKKEFQNKLRKKELINVNKYLDNWYGVSRSDIRSVQNDSVIISDITSIDEIAFELTLYSHAPIKPILIYCSSPSKEEIVKRHRERCTESRIDVSLLETEIIEKEIKSRKDIYRVDSYKNFDKIIKEHN